MPPRSRSPATRAVSAAHSRTRRRHHRREAHLPRHLAPVDRVARRPRDRRPRPQFNDRFSTHPPRRTDQHPSRDGGHAAVRGPRPGRVRGAAHHAGRPQPPRVGGRQGRDSGPYGALRGRSRPSVDLDSIFAGAGEVADEDDDPITPGPVGTPTRRVNPQTCATGTARTGPNTSARSRRQRSLRRRRTPRIVSEPEPTVGVGPHPDPWPTTHARSGVVGRG